MFKYCCKKIFRFKSSNQHTSTFSNVIYPNNKPIISSNSNATGLTMSKYKVVPTTEIVYNSRNVREKLGEGGASIVYKYESNGIQYACKKILKSRSVVEREINVLSLYKPNKYIVKYFGCHLNENVQNSPMKKFHPPKPHYIFMEYCRGRELFEMLKSNYNYKIIISIIYQLLSALKHLQKYNIVHADIKLENIIINNKNEIKLIDFGLSRIIEKGSILQLKTHIGTVGYVSPEVMVDNYITSKTDVWSVGVLMYILLNNVHLFDVVNRDIYKKQLIYLTETLQKGLMIYNKTVPISMYHHIQSFMVKTICYDKPRLTIKNCLKHKIFSNVSIL
jgi:serine/threonine protein kinase